MSGHDRHGLAAPSLSRMDGKGDVQERRQRHGAAGHEALGRCGVTIADVKCIIPHQANQRILSAVAERLGARRTRSLSTSTSMAIPPAASVAVPSTRRCPGTDRAG